MRIVLISDTHGLHRRLQVPGGDLLIHAGDFTFDSKLPSVLSDFNGWLGLLPHRHKVVIPGNHEFILEEPRNRGAITNAILLVDSGVEVEGLRIWGSPVTPLYGGGFGKSKPEDRRRHWAQVPEGLDILITHGPPFAILDHGSPSERREGCPQLLEAVFRAMPRVRVFGHINAGYGSLRTSDTLFVNASLLGEDGSLGREPIVIDLEARGWVEQVPRPADMEPVRENPAVTVPPRQERTLLMTSEELIKKALREAGVFPPSVLDRNYGDRVEMTRAEIIVRSLDEMGMLSLSERNHLLGEKIRRIPVIVAELQRRLPDGEITTCGAFRALGVGCCDTCHTDPLHGMRLVKLPCCAWAWLCCAVDAASSPEQYLDTPRAGGGLPRREEAHGRTRQRRPQG